jgi:hypothetical protein
LPFSLRGAGSYSIRAPRTLPFEFFSSKADQACSSGKAISAAAACSLVRIATGSDGGAGSLSATAARGAAAAGAAFLAEAELLALAGAAAGAGATCGATGAGPAK